VVRADVQRRRQAVLDKLTDDSWFLDLRLLAALGEPAYWSINRKGVSLQDHGASRLEMQPRNQGSEFVGSRLRQLAKAVADRAPAQVLEGLEGRVVRDESGKDQPDSRTATGFANPGPTDNVVAWCALWGISQLPQAARVNDVAATSGYLGKGAAEWFYLPYWSVPRHPARMRSVLTTRQLARAASQGLPERWEAADADVLAARAWLAARGVSGIVRFPVERFGSASAPERRAMLGTVLRFGGD
jgi:CRISPR-associated protein Csb3